MLRQRVADLEKTNSELVIYNMQLRQMMDAIGMSPHEFRKLLHSHPAPQQPIREVTEY